MIYQAGYKLLTDSNLIEKSIQEGTEWLKHFCWKKHQQKL